MNLNPMWSREIPHLLSSLIVHGLFMVLVYWIINILSSINGCLCIINLYGDIKSMMLLYVQVLVKSRKIKSIQDCLEFPKIQYLQQMRPDLRAIGVIPSQCQFTEGNNNK